MSIHYEELHLEGTTPIKGWVRGVPLEEQAHRQLRNIASLPFVGPWIAVMPDVHLGKGATVGSVVPTRGAIVPAAVGVDIGCGMAAVRTTLTANDLPDDLAALRHGIERAVPVGNGPGGEHRRLPDSIGTRLAQSGLEARLDTLRNAHPGLRVDKVDRQLGTLGGGNHFIEICLDEDDRVWVMLHSGSRGTGNRIGQYFMTKAKELMAVNRADFFLPDKDLSYLAEGTKLFDDYIEAMEFSQDYAMSNREIMMQRTLESLRKHLPAFKTDKEAINCHHNYATREHHFGENVWVTRKGAVRAREGDLGIIPGSMGTGSFIVRGLGNEQSFCSCSHGAGRVMSRTKAKQMISMEQHVAAMKGISARTDEGVLDESPAAYKDIGAVMDAQKDLVAIEHRLRQVVNIKG
jgi:tRNA-splicing ligase RtcB